MDIIWFMIICAGLGAALVIFLVVSAKREKRRAIENKKLINLSFYRERQKMAEDTTFEKYMQQNKVESATGRKSSIYADSPKKPTDYSTSNDKDYDSAFPWIGSDSNSIFPTESSPIFGGGSFGGGGAGASYDSPSHSSGSSSSHSDSGSSSSDSGSSCSSSCSSGCSGGGD